MTPVMRVGTEEARSKKQEELPLQLAFFQLLTIVRWPFLLLASCF
jgi:hypothetical protein